MREIKGNLIEKYKIDCMEDGIVLKYLYRVKRSWNQLIRQNQLFLHVEESKGLFIDWVHFEAKILFLSISPQSQQCQSS
jgi:hypothetical protein